MKNRIKELRQGYGISQAQLAKYLGVAQNTISYWEQGKYDIDTESLKKIANYFNCSVDYVLGVEEVPERNANAEINHEFLGESLTELEIELITQFRRQKTMREAVCKLLGIDYVTPDDNLTKPPVGEITNDMLENHKASGSRFDSYRYKVTMYLPSASGNIYIFTIYYT